jgi:hypothetical protein
MTVRMRLTGLMGVAIVAALALSGCSSSSHNKSAASSGPAAAAASSALPSAPMSSPGVAASAPADSAAASAFASAAAGGTSAGSTGQSTAKATPKATAKATSKATSKATPTPSASKSASPSPTALTSVAPQPAPTTTATQGTPVTIGSGLTVTLGPVTNTTSNASNCPGTHVFYGPAVQFTLTFSQPTDLTNAALNVAFGSSQTPGDACDAPAGSSTAVTYVIGIPKNLASGQQSNVTIDFYPPNSAKDYSFQNVAVN